MVGKILVDQRRTLRRLDFLHSRPGRPGGRRARFALLEENHVGHDFRSGVALERGLRQTDCPDQIGALGEEGARLVVELVHRPLAGHENEQAAGAHLVDGLGKEIIVQLETVLLVARVGGDFPRRERRVADSQIKTRIGEVLRDEVVADHALPLQQMFGNGGGDIVTLDADIAAVGRQAFRRSDHEQAGSHSRLHNLAAVKTELLDR